MDTHHRRQYAAYLNQTTSTIVIQMETHKEHQITKEMKLCIRYFWPKNKIKLN